MRTRVIFGVHTNAAVLTAFSVADVQTGAISSFPSLCYFSLHLFMFPHVQLWGCRAPFTHVCMQMPVCAAGLSLARAFIRLVASDLISAKPPCPWLDYINSTGDDTPKHSKSSYCLRASDRAPVLIHGFCDFSMTYAINFISKSTVRHGVFSSLSSKFT